MKNKRLTRIISVASAVFISTSGFVSLLVDEVFKPFLDTQPEAKLVIILISVLSAYHVFLTFTFSHIVKEEHIVTNNKLDYLSEKSVYFHDLVPYFTT